MVPEWQGFGLVKRFITELYKQCKVASGRHDCLERPWLMEVLDKKTKLEDLAKSWPLMDGTGDPRHQGRMERLDLALVPGMRLLFKTHAQSSMHKIKKMEEQACFDGGPELTGRQYVWLFIKSFKGRGELNHASRIQQIHNMVYPGDHKMKEFYENWTSLVEDVDAQLPPEVLRQVLYEKLVFTSSPYGGSEELALDLSVFDRMDEDDDDYSHEWLLKCMERHIRRKQDKKNMVAYNREIGRLFNAPVKDPYGGGTDCAPADADDEGWTEEGAEEEPAESDPDTEPEDEWDDEDDYDGVEWVPTTDADLALCCYYYAHGRCWYGDRCRFWHAEVTREQRDRMVPPPLGSSRR